MSDFSDMAIHPTDKTDENIRVFVITKINMFMSVLSVPHMALFKKTDFEL